MEIILRETSISDLAQLFEFQSDLDSNWIAAFTPPRFMDWEEFRPFYLNLIANPGVQCLTILNDEVIVGSMLEYGPPEMRSVGYWIRKDFWGRGVASEALRQFLVYNDQRPLFASAAADNFGSMKVLTNCGFKELNRKLSHSEYRNEAVMEVFFILDKSNENI